MSKLKGPGTPVSAENGNIPSLEGMYREYFIDYASYVILERAIPAAEDGFKPVQRRILHSLKKMDDGRFHKVANVIGQTMQYHPHGDAAIGDALVKLGQKNLLIDTQGNWGDPRTGDSAAAARYIEARLTKFALEVVFNPQTTEWQLSYDGRNREPITLPVKFPMVLAQGAEGIAVGLSTKILPHNFVELIKASIKVLQEKRVKIYPDFDSGGMIDVTDYNGGKRGGRVKVRARIEQRDKKTLAITDLPYGVTTSTLIDSILKANDKGKIQIKKVIDNTAQDVEILLELGSGVSPDLTTDALYAFTNCEVPISPNAVVIIDEKPHFLTVEEILKISTANTKGLLKKELDIKQRELEEKWHISSLEKIFIQERIYRDIEECETWESVLETIDAGLRKYVVPVSEKPIKNDARLRLNRDITEEDLVKLTEIKIKRISKYNVFKADELIAKTEEELKEVKYNLNHLTDYAIAFFQHILDKYGKGRERKTEITEFDTIKARRVVAKNAKLYVNTKEGFIGTGLKKDEFVSECSDIDDIIAFTKSGLFKVVKVDDKVFVGKNILHTAVWKKNDDRTTYNLIYLDGKTGRAMAKRFNVKAITRNKDYNLTTGASGSRILYFSANPNGESEIVEIQLSPGCKAKKKIFPFDFAELEIKGRSSKGNIVTKWPVKRIVQTEIGTSSLGAVDIWIDEVSGRINKEERGKYLGSFDTGDCILAVYKDGSYEVTDLDFDKKYEISDILDIGKLKDDTVISTVYYEGEKGWTMVKRFNIETSTLDQKFQFISEHKSSKVYFATITEDPIIQFTYKKGREKKVEELDLSDFISVKGWKALGNKLGEYKLLKVDTLEKLSSTNGDTVDDKKDGNGKLTPGETIEFDF